MRLSFQDTFPCSPQAYWDGLLDEELIAHLATSSGTGFTLVEQREERGITVRHERYTLPTAVPAPIARAIGRTHFEYDQVTRLDPATHTATWRILPPAGSARVRAEGTFAVRAHPEGCLRVMEGEVEVKVPLIGATIEKLVCEGISRAFEQGTAARRAWMSDRSG
jgi:hypothetical protein